MRFSIIVIHRNGFDILHKCISSIINAASNDDEIILIDNNSSDDSISRLKSSHLFQKIKLIENKCNSGYGQSCNQGMKLGTGKYFLLCNSDIKIDISNLNKFEEFMKHDNVGLIGPQMHSPDGYKMNSYGTIPLDVLSQLDVIGRPRRNKLIENFGDVEILRGACLAVKKAMLKDTGAYDEDFYFYHEETEWCLRIKKSNKWRVTFAPEINITHVGGASTENLFKESRIEFFRSRMLFWKKCFPFHKRLLIYLINFPKLPLDLVFYLSMYLLTLGTVKSYRRKTIDRAVVILWLLLGKPKKWGLPDKCH